MYSGGCDSMYNCYDSKYNQIIVGVIHGRHHVGIIVDIRAGLI